MSRVGSVRGGWVWDAALERCAGSSVREGLPNMHVLSMCRGASLGIVTSHIQQDDLLRRYSHRGYILIAMPVIIV